MRLPHPTFASARWMRLRWLVLFFVASLPSLAAAEASSPALADALKQARVILAKDAADVAGLAVAVAYEGKIVWSEGFGYADLETKRRVSPSTTRFRLASVSKPLTTAGLMRLVERGRVDLDVPVQTYIPTFPVKKEGVITTRLLAGHLAGIRHYRGLEALRMSHSPPCRQVSRSSKTIRWSRRRAPGFTTRRTATR